MIDIGQIRALFIADGGKFREEVRHIAGDLRAVGKSGKDSSAGVSKLSGSLSALNGMAAQVIGGASLAGITAMAVSLGRDSIKAASDVQEMQSKFRIVFRDQAAAVEDELARFGGAVGRSKYELMGYASMLQDTFVPLGFAREQAAKMSVQVTKLAVDLASFNNLRTEDVVRDLQSALVGNTETLRKYGVVASDAAIKQRALNAGLWDGRGTMDAQTKASVIMQMALDGNADAMGDAARTADSFANRQRALDAATLDAKVALGELFLPAATAVVDTLGDAAKTTTTMIRWQGGLADAYHEAASAALASADDYGDYITQVLQAASAAGKLYGANAEQAEAAARARAALGELERQYGTLTDEALLALYEQGDITAEQYNQMQSTLQLASAWSGLAEEMHLPATEQEFEALRADLDGTSRKLDGYIGAQLGAQEATLRMADAAEGAGEPLSLLQGALDGLPAKFDAAKTAAGLLSDGIKQVSRDAADQARVMAVLEIAQGDMTQAEIEARLEQVQQLDMLAQVNQALEDDKITRYDWINIVADGVVTQEELNRALGVSYADIIRVGEAVQGIDGLSASLRVDVSVTKSGELPPEASGYGWGGDAADKGVNAAFATGTPQTGFVVPPGYPADTYRVGLTSGERLYVEPPGSWPGRGGQTVINNNDTYHITITDSGAAALTMAMIDERRRARVLEGI